MIGSISFITSLASVSFMPVPDALCIIFACPVVTMVLSAIMLGDKLNSVKFFSGTLLLLGVVLVCQPPFLFPNPPSSEASLLFLLSSHDDLYYVGVALAGLACLTGGFMDVLIAKCEVSLSTRFLVLTIAFCIPGSLYASPRQLVSHLRAHHHPQLLPSYARVPHTLC